MRERIFVATSIVATILVLNLGSTVLGDRSASEITLLLMGDVMLGRTVMTRSLAQNDPAYPFKKTADALRSADLMFVNLENPIVDNCPSTSSGLIFCADPKMAEGLTYAGIDVVTLANNHSLNYGPKGMENTKKVLTQKGIGYVGLGNLEIKNIEGLKIGFLGFEFIDKNITQKDIELIKSSNSQVDVLVVGVHWGAEYQAKADKKQKEIAKILVDNGADIVAGHHPHWVQDMENINGKPVYYSLGNFVFDQMWSTKTREGLVIRLTLDSNGNIKKEEKLPIFMTNWAQPEWK